MSRADSDFERRPSRSASNARSFTVVTNPASLRIASSSPWRERWLRTALAFSRRARSLGTFLTDSVTVSMDPLWIHFDSDLTCAAQGAHNRRQRHAAAHSRRLD